VYRRLAAPAALGLRWVYAFPPSRTRRLFSPSRLCSAAERRHTRHGDGLDPIGPLEGTPQPSEAGLPLLRRGRRDAAGEGGGGYGPLRSQRRRAPELSRFLAPPPFLGNARHLCLHTGPCALTRCCFCGRGGDADTGAGCLEPAGRRRGQRRGREHAHARHVHAALPEVRHAAVLVSGIQSFNLSKFVALSLNLVRTSWHLTARARLLACAHQLGRNSDIATIIR
jgi:hypothetical protein